jgi:ribonucleoside-diphosphate reductase beta chain
MAAVFGAFELAIHKPFYSKLNELLYIDTEDFYSSYVNDPTLKSRMEFIDSIVGSNDELLSLAGFSMVEGAILYTSFAFLKHFQSKGKNKLLNVVRGINFSVRDENLHSIAGAYVFKKKMEAAKLTDEKKSEIKETIQKFAAELYEHECRIVDMIFEKGPIDGITPAQMKHFVESRINNCLNQLGYTQMFKITYNPIAEWFYDGINGYQYNDFFSGMGSQYNRNWDEQGFKW